MNAHQNLNNLCAPLFIHAAQHPEKPAFIHGADSVDYGTLANSAARGAELLAHLGCRPGDRVAVALPKDLNATRAIFSILALGAVFVPVDPGTPIERLLFILNDAQPRIIVTTSRVKSALDQVTEGTSFVTVCVDDNAAWHEIMAGSGGRNAAVMKVSPEAPAVFYYTSGTTGKPKAIVLSHLNVISFVDWAIQYLELKSADRFASHAPIHFDLSTLELYASIRLGATAVLLDEVAVKFPARASQILEEHKVTVIYSVPTALRLLVRLGALGRRDLSELRLILFAGESYPLRPLRELIEALPERRLYNLYGPTETNVCTYFRIPNDIPEDWKSLPIGSACEHLSVLLLKDDDGEASEGEEGELTVFGPSVMLGYWNNRPLTESCRVGGVQQSHRTGDLAVRGPDGNFRLIGRRDDMVKIRGHRVELGEVCAVLEAVPGVSEAVAILVGDEPESIVAVVSLEENADVSAELLHRRAKSWLPSYSIPSEIILVSNIPRTTTGKIDRQQLRQQIQERP